MKIAFPLKDFRISVAGIPGSGKTLLCRALSENMGFVVVPLDSWYRGKKELDRLGIKSWDFPEAYNQKEMKKAFELAKEDGNLRSPIYSKEVEGIIGHEEIPLEGKLVYDGVYSIRDRDVLESDLTIYIEINPLKALIRKIRRDGEYGYSIFWTIKEWVKYTYPLAKKFIQPSKEDADIVVKNNGDSQTLIDNCIAEINAKYSELTTR